MNRVEKAKHRVYPDLEYVYEYYKIKGHYKFENTDELLDVLGFRFESTKGFNKLSKESQAIAIRALLRILNGYGLEYRDTFWPISLEDEPEKKRLLFRITSGEDDNESSWILYYNGNIE